MTKTDYPAFNAGISRLFLSYRETASEEIKALWFEDLQPYPIGAVLAAFERHRKGCKFVPNIAHILEILGGGSSDQSEAAWIEVARAAERVGGYRSVAFADPATQVAIESMGGWIRFCLTPERERPHTAREFRRAYESARARIDRDGVAVVAPAHILLGEHGEAEPTVVGDVAAARAWVQLVDQKRDPRELVRSKRFAGLLEDVGQP